MAASATPSRADSSVVAVAFSGGRDSTALLHATVRAAAARGVRVLALHVHHGLSPHADEWLAHCQRFAQGLGAHFLSRRLNGLPAAGQSIEAWAREGRHAALQSMCLDAGCDLLLLAHHRRDQAETFLLQALRGAGMAGLAAMPSGQWREGVYWTRPWLDWPRETVEAYVREHELSFIEDDSNRNERFARNRLRNTVWPLLDAPDAALAQSARWAQQALDLQREMAAVDLPRLVLGESLDLAALRKLSAARASNALRQWLFELRSSPAPASLVERLLEEAEGHGEWPFDGGLLCLYRGLLSWRGVSEALSGPSQIVNLSFAGVHEQPDWSGRWHVESVTEMGVARTRLAQLMLRARSGGEQFQRAPKSTPRSLKKAWQEAGVPAWERDGPLLFQGDQIVFAPRLGIDARVLAAPGEPQFKLRWEPKA